MVIKMKSPKKLFALLVAVMCAVLAAVAAVGAAGRHIFLAVKADVAVAALAGLDPDFRNIYKHGVTSLKTRFFISIPRFSGKFHRNR